MAHTKGTWEACGKNNSRRVTIKSEGKLIAVVKEGENDWDNARLIASAPDMLDCLKDVARLLDVYANSTEPSLKMGGVDAEIFRRAKELIRNAR